MEKTISTTCRINTHLDNYAKQFDRIGTEIYSQETLRKTSYSPKDKLTDASVTFLEIFRNNILLSVVLR